MPNATHDPARDALYRELLLSPLRKCADYLPKMGGGDEVDLPAFKVLYGGDPLYRWVGLDSDLMFAAHKAAGGMTSVYRQLGIGCERLFREILRDELGLNAEQVKWSYEVLVEENGKPRVKVLTLDGRVEMGDVSDLGSRARVNDWIENQKTRLGITAPIKGAVFEVRQGYKSADSKRQNADLGNAAQALGDGYLPTLVVMSTQMNQVVRARYETGNWAVLTGTTQQRDPLSSTFDFVRDVVGYDLVAFFERNTQALRGEVETILVRLLEPR